MKPYANLHLHSTHSDGVYTPAELVKIAKAEGYKALAITDHDTATAYPELESACKEAGMECIFGVEFSVKEPAEYHIIGYHFDPEYPPMKIYLEDMARCQTDNTKKCFNMAVEKGDIKGIEWQEVLDFNRGIKWICNNHVFRAMKAKGLIEDKDYVEWFNRNFNQQRKTIKPICEFKNAKDLIALVNEAGGFTVLAHPHNQLDDVPQLVEFGLKGIETSHADLTSDERKRAYEIAIENDLFISGGTDHEGLCGGFYSSFETEDELKKSHFYVEPLSIGVAEKHFREIQNGKIRR